MHLCRFDRVENALAHNGGQKVALMSGIRVNPSRKRRWQRCCGFVPKTFLQKTPGWRFMAMGEQYPHRFCHKKKRHFTKSINEKLSRRIQVLEELSPGK